MRVEEDAAGDERPEPAAGGGIDARGFAGSLPKTGDLGALVARASAGDVSAFRELFSRYAEPVRRYALAQLRDPEEARDMVQEVFLAVWRGLPSFRYEHEGSFPGWVFGIARNLIGTQRRRTSRALRHALEELPERALEFESGAVSDHLVTHELAKLPDAQREVLVLRFVVGLTARETAAALHKSETSVNALQLRGLRRLRHRLGEVT